MLRSLRIVSLLVVVSLFPILTRACPRISNLCDFNCDREIRIAVTGDSITRGIGGLPGEGGYVTRIGERLPKATVLNIGVPGITSKQLLRGFKKNLRINKTGITFEKSRDTDIFIIAVGVNDYWGKLPVENTVTNIRRLVAFLRSRVRALSGVTPYIVVATIPPIKRDFQKPFVAELNERLLAEASDALPVKLRFDLLPSSIVSDDLLHPDAAGYVVMGDYIAKFLRSEVQKTLFKLRPDVDRDGVYDTFELSRYLTDPLTPDSDGDGLTDREEIFIRGTNPIAIDSDGDGRSDKAEVDAGTDPMLAEG